MAQLNGRAIYALYTDRNGAPLLATDDHGQPVWAAAYSPFGKAKVTTHRINVSLRAPGQYADGIPGVYYNYYRDYNTKTGRYLTSDPIGLNGGVNTYAYVGSNPLTAIDPLGLEVYVAGRDLNAGGLPGTHMYLVLIPDNSSDFSGTTYIAGKPYSLRDVGIGTQGFVIGAHNINNRLKVKLFEEGDFTATREDLVPGIFTNPFIPDFSPEFKKVTANPCSTDSANADTQLIKNIIASVNNYSVNEARQPISRYPSWYEQFDLYGDFVNSNSWAHSVIDSVSGSINGGNNFDGFDALGSNRIPVEYFEKHPGKLPELNQ